MLSRRRSLNEKLINRKKMIQTRKATLSRRKSNIFRVH